MVKLCLSQTKKQVINAVARTILSTHILGCLIWKRTYFNSNYNYSNDLLTPPLFHLFHSVCLSLFYSVLSDCYLGWFNCALSLMTLCTFFLPLPWAMIMEAAVEIVNKIFDSIFGANSGGLSLPIYHKRTCRAAKITSSIANKGWWVLKSRDWQHSPLCNIK